MSESGAQDLRAYFGEGEAMAVPDGACLFRPGDEGQGLFDREIGGGAG